MDLDSKEVREACVAGGKEMYKEHVAGGNSKYIPSTADMIYRLSTLPEYRSIMTNLLNKIAPAEAPYLGDELAGFLQGLAEAAEEAQHEAKDPEARAVHATNAKYIATVLARLEKPQELNGDLLGSINEETKRRADYKDHLEDNPPFLEKQSED
ncbi:MAG: hypothetical protein ACE5FW_01180 [Candidatus Aenigmatarchaeota archaeon]